MREIWRTRRVISKIRSLPKAKRRESLSAAAERVFSSYDVDEDGMLNEKETVALFAGSLSDPYDRPLSSAQRLFGCSPPISKASFVKAVAKDQGNIDKVSDLLLRLGFDEEMIFDKPEGKVSLSLLIFSWKDLCLSADFKASRCLFAFRGACAVVSLAMTSNALVSSNDIENLEIITKLRGLADYFNLREEIRSNKTGFLARASRWSNTGR